MATGLTAEAARRAARRWPASTGPRRSRSCASAASPPPCCRAWPARPVRRLARRARRARSVRARGRSTPWPTTPSRPADAGTGGGRASARSRWPAAGGFKVALLHGVTGSGKTEVYLRAGARGAPTPGRQVLLLVPEIALTPSVSALFRGAFGDRVAIQHSALSDGERHDQWQRIRRGDVDVVVGTRSAVFAPLDAAGARSSWTRSTTPPTSRRRRRAITGATWPSCARSARARWWCSGSATPSMESYQHAESGKYVKRGADEARARSSAGRRARREHARGVRRRGPGRRDQPRARRRRSRSGWRAASRCWCCSNRRGYATAVFCRQCGDTFECPNCSISLTVHTARNGWRARCHYCNYSVTVPKACRKCAAPYLEHAGLRHREGRGAACGALPGGAHRPRRSRLGAEARAR